MSAVAESELMLTLKSKSVPIEDALTSKFSLSEALDVVADVYNGVSEPQSTYNILVLI